MDSEEARRLHNLRHSTAHVMAQAIKRLKPEVRLAIGPPIEDGFYYDIDPETPFTEEDLATIEKTMKGIVKENQPFEHETWSKEEARQFFGNETFKLELIEDIEDETVSIYRNNAKDGSSFVDLCAGPHVMRTGQCKHFKLLKLSGAYWRGDSSKKQLQRIYGTVWPRREELDQHLFRLEEAKKRDHRRLGQQLDLFMFHEYAPGAAFWLPRGEELYDTLASRMRGLLKTTGYSVVRTPLVFDEKLWKTSGHWDHYRDNMFHFPEKSAGAGGKELERNLGIKPMNCPCHMLIFGSKKRSYRDLPMRIHDQGVLHRNELTGALGGLTRVRQFCQDDAHLFCSEEQIASEVEALLGLVDHVYKAFDLSYACQLATRPVDKLGDDALWDQAEAALAQALDARGLEYSLNEGDGAFYGPKIDFDVFDALGRAHQCATVQLDFQLPRRFELSYTGADNQPHVPVVIHRAIFGSFERFIAILIEHYAGNFPVWLAPEQVRVLTVSEKSTAYAQKVVDELKAAGIKIGYDDSNNKIGYKIRSCHAMKLPYMAIIGEREIEGGTVSVRSRDHGDLGSLTTEAFVGRVAEEARLRF